MRTRVTWRLTQNAELEVTAAELGSLHVDFSENHWAMPYAVRVYKAFSHKLPPFYFDPQRSAIRF